MRELLAAEAQRRRETTVSLFFWNCATAGDVPNKKELQFLCASASLRQVVLGISAISASSDA